MKELLFVSQNTNKLKEIRAMLPRGIRLLGLKDINWKKPIDEPFDTYEANAKAKAMEVFSATGIDCFADDSGLEVAALNGAPGFHSARYAGTGCTDADNVKKLLEEMKGVADRGAQFVAVIALMTNAYGWNVFNGTVKGVITEFPAGTNGFGYDPVFKPLGYDATFAEMGDEIKNTISHRAKAMKGLIDFLKNTNGFRPTHQ